LRQIQFNLLHDRALALPKDMRQIIKFRVHASSDCSLRLEEHHPETLTDKVINRMLGRKPRCYFEFRVKGLEFWGMEAHQFPLDIHPNILEIRALFDSGEGKISILIYYENDRS